MTGIQGTRMDIASEKANVAWRGARPSTRPAGALTIGIVNNMPVTAFEATNRQLVSLLAAGAKGLPIEIRGYRLPHLDTAEASLRPPLRHFEDLDALYDELPDALIVTGLNPTCADITLEPFWGDLAKLVQWAHEEVPSTLLSCLAAHAAVVTLHGTARVPLPAKSSGVFAQTIDRSHFLTRHMGDRVSFPHSRFNDIPSNDLLRHGYDIVVASPESGWTIATREESGRLLVLLQGHPEYASTTLLREYRRDVSEYLRGTTSAYPEIPVGYLNRGGEERLHALRREHERARSAMDARPFPFRSLCRHVRAHWQDAAALLFANWLDDVCLRRHRFNDASEVHRACERTRV